MDEQLREQFAALHGKLDRLLDPEEGIYAKLAAHRSEDAVKHRTIYLVLAAAIAAVAGGPHVARLLLAALG